MSVINTNYLALVSQNNLTKSQGALGTAIERLSSGLRINSAKDDAAGQAIANRFTANIKGLTQAARNANDGISIAQTTEGALNEINNNLQRVRELTVQAANGSNSESDLASIQAEIGQRLEEINRVSEQTQFNGVHVLAKDNALTIQVGAHDSQTITVDLQEITGATLGLNNLDVTNQVTSKSLTAVGTELKAAVPATPPVTLPATTVELTYTGGTPAAPTLVVGDDGDLYAQTANGDLFTATYDSAAGTVSFNTGGTAATGVNASGATTFVDAGGNLVQLATAQGAEQENAAGDPAFSVFQNTTTGSLVVSDGADTWTIGTGGNSIDLSSGAVTLSTKDGSPVAVGTGHDEVTSGNVLTLNGTTTPGTAEVPAVNVDLTAANAALGGTGTNVLMQKEDGGYLIQNTDGDVVKYYEATANMATGVVTTSGEEVLVDPLDSIDQALAQVDSLRSDLGAIQNRFQSTIANLSNTINNLSAARSRIEDADYAVEVSNMTRAQILQQAGTSVLAQANQVPQTVLSLLR